MTQSERDRFAALIRARLDALAGENERGSQGRETVELDQQAIGRLSRMDALQNQAMANAQQTRRDGEAAALNAALARIGSGTFGECEDCGEDIAPGRLELNPTATRCISCASG